MEVVMKGVRRGYVWAVCMLGFLLFAADTVNAAYTGEGQKTLVLKSGSEGPPNELGTQGAVRFAELMKQRTNGKIQITHYP
ncbi:MAG: Bacterial extracellular solute-binding protein, family 7, partial [Deltaproteobacteria bacterium]|nr:Bacterial extracellular solute-binding protein, family 7 [Deltaproteobacteria bacterium]